MSAASGFARRYLLGALTGDEQDRFEIEMLGSAAVLDEIDDAEDELVESYLEGTLTAGEREAFERHYLASEAHRANVAAARLLREDLRREDARATPRRRARTVPLPWALAATLLLAGGAAFWWSQAPRPSARTASGPGTPAPVRPRAGGDVVRVATLSLAPGRAMGTGAAARAVLTDTTSALRLELLLEDAAVSACRASLTRTGAPGEIWSGQGLKPVPVQGGALLVVEPKAADLIAGSYELTLFAEPSGARVGTYYFDVTR